MLIAIILTITLFACLTCYLIKHPTTRHEDAKDGFAVATLLCLLIATMILVAQFVIIESGDRFKKHETLEEYEAYPVQVDNEHTTYSVVECGTKDALCAIINKDGKITTININGVVIDDTISTPVVKYIKHSEFKNFGSLFFFYPIPYKGYTLYLPAGGDTNA